MKNPLLLVCLGVFCLALPARHVVAQSGFNPGAAGSNPFGRVYNPPANPPAVALPQNNVAVPGAPGTPSSYNAALAGLYSGEPVEPNHKLNRGDVLNFQVVEERDPKWQSGQLQVLDSGDINMPLGGLVPAAGKTVAQLISDVRARLERDYYYHATVIMAVSTEARRPSRGQVFITGAVRTECAVELPLDSPLTVSNALTKCGGFKDFADLKKVRLIRKNSTGKPTLVNIAEIRKGKLDSDAVLEAGDSIYVPEKLINL